MTQVAKKYFTPEEYLALEEKAVERSEYYQGEIYMMPGGTPRHNRISANVSAEINFALRDLPCQNFSSDQRLLVNANGLFTYPDGIIICGEIELSRGRKDTVTNPILLVEVLSPSTRDYDRGGKFELYRALPTFEHYLLVDQERVFVEYFQRTPEGWLLRTYNDLAQSFKVPLPGGEIALSLANFYRKIVFAPEPPVLQNPE